MKKVKIALIGAGNRGMTAYAPYALEHPYDVQFVAVAEKDEERRKKFQELHNIPDSKCFATWQELLEKRKLADAVLICTLDNLHFEPTMKAIEKGYHIMLEKPMATTPLECIKIAAAAEKSKRILLICHVLRYTQFFTTIKKMLERKRIGQLISISHNENVGFVHHSHSYVRGNWRNSDESSPMILAKSCHDLDILLWMAGADCTNLSSYGYLSHFTASNAPDGAPKRCLDGCIHQNNCIFYAPNIYLTPNIDWPTSVISSDTSLTARFEALQVGPYGRCVYHCDNNVVDHQVVCMEFNNQVTANFTMCAFTNGVSSRTIKLMGTQGEISGHMEKGEIQLYDFKTGRVEVINLIELQGGHCGGDLGLIKEFVRMVKTNDVDRQLTSATTSLQSHIMAFAAEESRLEKKVVNIPNYYNDLYNKHISL